MPIMLYSPGAVATFSRECLRHHIAVVVVGFPATSLVAARARVCISAAHLRSDLDYALYVFEKVGREVGALLNAPGKTAKKSQGLVQQIAELGVRNNGKTLLL
jgi:serine palmitoyltransferase